MPSPIRGRIPLAVKLIYTAFMAVLVPYYWKTYGPTNFLYFCDVSLFFALAAMWLESPLLASAPAVGLILPQILWQVDFILLAIGMPILGMTDYMFDENIPFIARGLSFFHFWLPILLAWMVWRLGYDKRGARLWTGLAWVLMLIGYFVLPAPPAPADNLNLPVNVNYVYGFSQKEPQKWMPPLQYLGLLFVGLPLLIFLPTHLLLSRFFPKPTEPGPQALFPEQSSQ